MGKGLLYSIVSGAAQGYGNEMQRQAKFDDERSLMQERMALEEQKQLRIDEVTRARNRSDKTWEQTDLAPLARENKLADSEALAKQKPELAKYEGEAEAVKMRETAPVKAELELDAEKKRLNDPDYIAGLGKKARATHIESASSVASANLSRYQLEKAQRFEQLQTEYADAVTAGNQEKARELANRIEAMNFTGKAKDVQAYIHAATQARKLAAETMDDAEKRELLSKANIYEKLAGIDERGGSGGGAPKSGAPYAEGTRLRGKDGKTYVVRNGKPVLE